MRRSLALLVLAAGALLVGAALVGPTAWAHSMLIASDPADGLRTATGPARVALTFSEPVQTGFTTVTVVGPDGNQWHAGPPVQEGAVVTVPVQPLGPVGEYTIGYRVLSADSHPVRGSIGFTLTQPGSGAPGPPAPSAGPPPEPAATGGGDAGADSAPVWPWIVGALVLLGAGVAAALRLGRSA